MNRFDEVLIVNPGVPDAERERPMYGYYAQSPEEAVAGYGDPYGYGYAAYPDPNGYGYYGYGDPGLYAAPVSGYAGFADGYGGYGYGGYGYAAPYGYAAVDPYGYGNVDPYAMGQVDPQVYGPGDPYGYDGYDYAPGYGQEDLAAYGYYGAADPYVYGMPTAETEMGSWSGVETAEGSAPAFYADAEPDLGGYTRDLQPPPFNAVCPIVGNVRFGDADEFGGYVAPAPVGPACGSFTPQPGTPPPIPDTFRPLW